MFLILLMMSGIGRPRIQCTCCGSFFTNQDPSEVHFPYIENNSSTARRCKISGLNIRYRRTVHLPSSSSDNGHLALQAALTSSSSHADEKQIKEMGSVFHQRDKEMEWNGNWKCAYIDAYRKYVIVDYFSAISIITHMHRRRIPCDVGPADICFFTSSYLDAILTTTLTWGTLYITPSE
jgi:hypothetical protein